MYLFDLQTGLQTFIVPLLGAINTQKHTYEQYLASGLNSPEGRLLMHEFGHSLQRQKKGGVYYIGIAASSVYNINTKKSYDYDRTWTEVDANTRSYLHFESPSFWKFYDYLINEKVRKTEELIKKLYSE